MDDFRRNLPLLWSKTGQRRTQRELLATWSRSGGKSPQAFSEGLSALISDGLVERDGGGWALTEQGRKARKRLVGAEGGAGAVERSQSKIAHPDASGDMPVSDSNEDCAILRRVLSYYIDCVRLEERPSATMYAEDYNKKFISLPLHGQWWAEDGTDPPPASVNILPSQSDFVRNVARSEGEELFVGYPLFVFHAEDEDKKSLVVPIFCLPAVAEQDGHVLELTLDFADADVNSDWLSRQFRSNEERRAFLRQCGLLDPMQEELEDNDAGLVELFDVKSAAVAVETFCGKKVIGERVNPRRPDAIGDFEHAETGIYNAAMLYAGKRLRYTAGLLRELRTIRDRASNEDLRRSALRHVFGLRASYKSDDEPEEQTDSVAENAGQEEAKPVPFLPFNQEQEDAVRASLDQGLTVITGPPGTGKSQVAANIICNLTVRKQTAMFASRNHKALDAVVPRTNGLAAEGTVVYRTNNQETGESFTWKDAIRLILATPQAADDGGEYECLLSKVNTLLAERSHLLEVAELWTSTERELGQVTEEWDRKTEELPFDIVEHITAGADLPDEKLLETLSYSATAFPDESVPPWKSWLLRIFWRLRHYRGLRSRVPELRPPLATYELELPEIAPTADLCSSLLVVVDRLRVFRRLNELHHRTEKLNGRVAGLTPLAEVQHSFKETLDNLAQQTGPLLDASLRQRTTGLDYEDRRRLTQMRGVLGHLSGPAVTKQMRIRWDRFFAEQLQLLLRFFPAWAVTNLSVRHCLPVAPAVVDTVIIDEASQCDIASVIPLLYRAKRAVIVGDPNQLAPVHNLKSARNQMLLQKHRLLVPELLQYDFLAHSSYDIAACSSDPIMLKDHYRSHLDIIDYCNSTFYNDFLRIETNHAGLRLPKGWSPGIHWTDVVGTAEGAPRGAICQEEIEAVTRILHRLLVKEQFDGTVGVVTPFAVQANRISDWADRNLPAKIRLNSQLVCSTAHKFQGDERDVMICSPVFQPGVPRGSLWFITDEQNRNLWNVAISRARALLHVVGNFDMCSTCDIKHLRNLAERATQPSADEQTRERSFESPWERKLYDALEAQGIHPWPQYSLAGKRLDLALPEVQLDIEVDGERYHRDEYGRRKAEDLWRDIAVKAAGWTPLRFWVYELRRDMDECVHTVKREIARLSAE